MVRVTLQDRVEGMGWLVKGVAGCAVDRTVVGPTDEANAGKDGTSEGSTSP